LNGAFYNKITPLFFVFIIAGSYVIFNDRWRELVFAPQPPVDSAARRKTDHSTALSIAAVGSLFLPGRSFVYDAGDGILVAQIMIVFFAEFFRCTQQIGLFGILDHAVSHDVFFPGNIG
jgi:hypothetical protein